MRQPPADGVDPAWLRLRGPADVRTRTSCGSGLVDDLAAYLGATNGGVGACGAGTGAGANWRRDQLAGRLAVGPRDRQRWRLVDHDPALLASAAPATDGWARGVVATVDELPGLLADDPADVVTCQALLDVLTASEVDAVIASAMDSGACAPRGRERCRGLCRASAPVEPARSRRRRLRRA